ncbi:hypothetical protein TEA_008912 [Camellia sinensis var. sinensis]|uniref:Uncharacterized protein n=1 Tax=Camellia sinensis var. sinensis TaxID=542762 RepID=A0A4S4EJV4_CAMSN|nr:hypothetical protein TEA_008912 [Camellia sinensis var. sinensis]
MNKRASTAAILSCFLALLFMALLTFVPNSSKPKKQTSKPKRKHHKNRPSSWDQIKNLLSCKQMEQSKVHDPSKTSAGYAKLGSCSSICSFRDVVHGNTSRVVHRADNSPESSSLGQETRLLSRKAVNGSTSNRSLSSSARSNASGVTHTSSSSKGMQLRKLSGCYECRTIVDPSRENFIITICCWQTVSELGPEDSGRNIVEIIFKSSWLKKDNPVCKIERILKVHNTRRTIQRFEDCRDAVKIRVNANTKKNPRCAADGNELLRFHSTTLSCTLGARGSSSLCGLTPGCGVCTVIKHGFSGKASDGKGVRTTASSGRAHDCINGGDGRRAMLVCRVIAGRVRRMADDGAEEEESVSAGSYDSVAGYAGIYSNLEELYVFNPRAILPCFRTISGRTCIEEISDDQLTIHNFAPDFVQLTDLQRYDQPPQDINVLFAVLQVAPTRKIKVKSVHDNARTESFLQEAVIIDKDIKPMILTLWEQFEPNKGTAISNMPSQFPIVIGIRLKATNYNGLVLNTTSGSTLILNIWKLLLGQPAEF